jgi:hypothetical protein
VGSKSTRQVPSIFAKAGSHQIWIDTEEMESGEEKGDGKPNFLGNGKRVYLTLQLQRGYLLYYCVIICITICGLK